MWRTDSWTAFETIITHTKCSTSRSSCLMTPEISFIISEPDDGASDSDSDEFGPGDGKDDTETTGSPDE